MKLKVEFCNYFMWYFRHVYFHIFETVSGCSRLRFLFRDPKKILVIFIASFSQTIRCRDYEPKDARITTIKLSRGNVTRFFFSWFLFSHSAFLFYLSLRHIGLSLSSGHKRNCISVSDRVRALSRREQSFTIHTVPAARVNYEKNLPTWSITAFAYIIYTRRHICAYRYINGGNKPTRSYYVVYIF